MRFRTTSLSRSTILLGLLLLLAIVATGCADDSSDAESSDTTTSTVAETTSTTVVPTTAAPTTAAHDEGDHDHDDDDEGHDDEATVEAGAEAVELNEPRRLLVVGSTDQATLEMIDLADGSAVSIELEAPVAGHGTAFTESGRYLLVAHAGPSGEDDDQSGPQGGVTVVDTGVWSEPHGTHFHYYTTSPTILGRVEGPRPSHLTSHDGLNALWFDGTGEFVVITEEDLENGEVTVLDTVATGQPHHGFAVPTHDAFFVTVPTDDMEGMPNVVGISDLDGVIQAESDCPSTHGEATLQNGGAAACGDGIVLLTENEGSWTSTYVPYPEVDDEDPFGLGAARSWILRPNADRSLLAAPHGTQHLLVADPDAETVQSFDLGRTLTIVGIRFLDDGHLIVLTNDGFVHLVEPDDGSIVTSLEVIAPFQEGPGEPWREVAVTGDHVYVTDPANNQVIEIAVGDDLTLERTFSLGFTPSGFLGVANG
jgi:hypothetical protein